MTIGTQTEGIEYRIVLLDPRSRQTLMCVQGGERRLVRVIIPPRSRPARQLCLALRQVWGVRALILEFLGGIGRGCVVAELLAAEHSSRFAELDPAQIPGDELSEEERAGLMEILRGTGIGPFCRLGWIEEALNWVTQITGTKLLSKATIEQYNAGGGASTLLHIRAESGASYWLKATGDANPHERRLTTLLRQLSPDTLPAVVGERKDWNAWLMKGHASTMADVPKEPAQVERWLGAAVDSLATLQAKTIARERSLFVAGAFDQRLFALRAAVQPLFEFIDEAMRHQTSTKVPRLEPHRSRELCKMLAEACSYGESLAIPATILHGDMNLGNLVFQNGQCQFLDWCEGCVGYPLTTLQYLLLLNPIETPELRDVVNQRLKGRYCAKFEALTKTSSLKQGLAVMPVLAAASAMYGRGDWLERDVTTESHRFAYVRTITRHMDTAACDPAFLRSLRVRRHRERGIPGPAEEPIRRETGS